MAVYTYSGYDDDQITWPGGTPTNGDTITFTQITDHLIEITDNDAWLHDGTDDRDDEDFSQTAVVYDELGAVETSGQIQPREEITLTNDADTHYMTRVYIAASNSYYYIFQDPAPQLNVEYTVAGVSYPMATLYSDFASGGVPCFTMGTLIRTPTGETPIENLRPGDLVETLDRGAQEILWIGRRRVTWWEMIQIPGLRPYRVVRDAFGPGCPQRDTYLSRQHRLLLSKPDNNAPQSRLEGRLAPVHSLAGLAGIAEDRPAAGVVYLHLLTAEHNILWANGMRSESLLLTSESPAQRETGTATEAEALLACPPGLVAKPMVPARPILPNAVARSLVASILSAAQSA